jgi:NAD(P)-dependent dehydrogenase (short-subunit alcohol dehydrogenase family)
MDDMFDLSGQVALVTGGTKGIGRAIAQRFAQHGASVVVASRKGDVCEEVAADINKNWAKNGAEAIGIACNVGYREQLEQLVDKALQKFGKIDICVPNAAVNPYQGPSIDTPDSAIDKVLATNVRSTFQLCNLCFPGMVERKHGSVIIIASVSGLKGSKDLGIYSISKVAEHQVARNFAVEYGQHGIRVNAIAPGIVKTDFAKTLWTDPERAERYTSLVPLRRFGEPDDIAGVALFLASKASAFVTGQVIDVCGGSSIV